jgi:hypothetical protein
MATNGHQQGLSGIRSNGRGPGERYSACGPRGPAAGRLAPRRGLPGSAEAPNANRDLLTYPLVVGVSLAETDQVTVSARQYPQRREGGSRQVSRVGEKQYRYG